MYAPLAPCPKCRRHVRVADGTCPFCAATIAPDTRVVPGSSSRLARGVAFVFATSTAAVGASAVALGCSSETSPGPTDTGTLASAYGVPADTGSIDTGSVDTGSDAGADANRDGASDAKDGGPDDTGGGGALYGDPPPDTGK